ncbi:hypothetical protein [Candidatus Thiosymbion oneisti]|uniref:hypothetical protein n=1 Tax=Candidatus Thiosymbion oneisti TaxID=589554 RepID=UPI00106058DB|nr:hypothetical protein [Candidatus Thiosymbion oneisti]
MFSNEQLAVTRVPKTASDGPLMELFEKHRSELPARQPVPMVPSATLSASAVASLFDPGAETPKQPERQGPAAKTESKVKAKKTAESSTPQRIATAVLPPLDPGAEASEQPERQGSAVKTERKAETRKTAESGTPKPSVAAVSPPLDPGAGAPKQPERQGPMTKARKTTKSEGSKRSAFAVSPLDPTDSSWTEIFEKYPSEAPAQPSVPMLLSATPSASAVSSLFDLGAEAPKRPERQRSAAKTERKAKAKKTAEPRTPKRSAAAASLPLDPGAGAPKQPEKQGPMTKARKTTESERPKRSAVAASPLAPGRGPQPVSDSPWMEIFEKHRSEVPAQLSVPVVLSATPSASAVSSLFDLGAEVPKRPERQRSVAKTTRKAKAKKTAESRTPKPSAAAASPPLDPGAETPKRPKGQGPAVKTERKAKAKKTAEPRTPKPSAAAASPPPDPGAETPKRSKGQGSAAKTKRKAKAKQRVKVKLTVKPRKPKPKVVRQPKSNLSDPTAWSPTYHGTK